ncbi:MAG: MarR family protein [Firmicutes bacterium]|nr:MarR family protein [Bacillota bacterium]
MSDIKLSEKVFQLIPFIDAKFMRPVEQHYAGDITPVQIGVLLNVKEKSALTMTALAKELLMSKQQLTPVVKDLVLRGLVQKKQDTSDHRVSRISLTPLGYKWHDDFTDFTLEMLKVKLEALDETDLACLNQAFTDIHRIIQKI